MFLEKNKRKTYKDYEPYFIKNVCSDAELARRFGVSRNAVSKMRIRFNELKAKVVKSIEVKPTIETLAKEAIETSLKTKKKFESTDNTILDILNRFIRIANQRIEHIVKDLDFEIKQKQELINDLSDQLENKKDKELEKKLDNAIKQLNILKNESIKTEEDLNYKLLCRLKHLANTSVQKILNNRNESE